MPLTKKQKQILKNSNYLDLIPVKLLSEEERQDGKIALLAPKFTNKFMTTYIVPKLKSPYFKIVLDELGSETWKQIDGKKNVTVISENLSAIFGERIQPVHQRLTKFLTDLFTQHFISFQEILNKGENNGK